MLNMNIIHNASQSASRFMLVVALELMIMPSTFDIHSRQINYQIVSATETSIKVEAHAPSGICECDRTPPTPPTNAGSMKQYLECDEQAD